LKNVLSALVAAVPRAPRAIAKDVRGQTTQRMRWLLNRLVRLLPRDECYLEIGLFRGATFISALLDNMDATGYGCDHWQQYDSEVEFRRNFERYRPRLGNATVYTADCFRIADRRHFRKPIGVYFYDGDHTEESQFRAVNVYGHLFADEVIVLVDDWNGPDIRHGTWRGVDSLRPRQVWFTELISLENFHNGVGAFHLRMR